MQSTLLAPSMGWRYRDQLIAVDGKVNLQMAFCKHFLLYVIFDQVIVNDPFLPLEAVHPAFPVDPVDPTRDSRCHLENII